MRLNKDNVINAICIFGLVISICIMLIVILKSFYAQKIDISFIKDIFSIGATLAASLIAISLFNDWKEQHNKTILAPEAIKIYKLISDDIQISADYKSFIKRNINQNLSGMLAAEIFTKFGNFIVIRTERVLALKYFSTLSKNEDIDILINEYSEFIDQHFNYLDPILRNKSGTPSSIDKQFIDINENFVIKLTNIQFRINKTLSDYIIVK